VRPMTAPSTASRRTRNAGARNDRRDRALAGATAAALYLLGPTATEQQRECVEALVEALEPRTKDGLQAIVEQCRERYGE
jgi:hypothetical protein